MDEAVKRELEIIKEGILQTVPDTEAIYLFGSYAYGTPHEDSDLDIYVVVPDTNADLVELRAGIRKSLRHKRLMPMDLLIGKSSAFNRRKHGPTLENAIVQEGVRFYGA